MTLEWKDPPPSRQGLKPGSARWQAIADELRAHPGQWALIGEQINGGYSAQIRNGRLTAFRPAGHYEAVTRSVDHRNIGDLYARYIGNGSEES